MVHSIYGIHKIQGTWIIIAFTTPKAIFLQYVHIAAMINLEDIVQPQLDL